MSYVRNKDYYIWSDGECTYFKDYADDCPGCSTVSNAVLAAFVASLLRRYPNMTVEQIITEISTKKVLR